MKSLKTQKKSGMFHEELQEASIPHQKTLHRIPEGFMTWVEMSNEVRMESIVNFAITIQNMLGCKTLDDLITKICKDRLYPDPKMMIIATTDEGHGLMREFNSWVKKEDSNSDT